MAFAQGDLEHPYVLGGLYNGKDKPQGGWADERRRHDRRRGPPRLRLADGDGRRVPREAPATSRSCVRTNDGSPEGRAHADRGEGHRDRLRGRRDGAGQGRSTSSTGTATQGRTYVEATRPRAQGLNVKLAGRRRPSISEQCDDHGHRRDREDQLGGRCRHAACSEGRRPDSPPGRDHRAGCADRAHRRPARRGRRRSCTPARSRRRPARTRRRRSCNRGRRRVLIGGRPAARGRRPDRMRGGDPAAGLPDRPDRRLTMGEEFVGSGWAFPLRATPPGEVALVDGHRGDRGEHPADPDDRAGRAADAPGVRVRRARLRLRAGRRVHRGRHRLRRAGRARPLGAARSTSAT